MPKYKIETTAQVRRVYEIDADSAEQAEAICDEHGDQYMVHEEDMSEEIDSTDEIKSKAA